MAEVFIIFTNIIYLLLGLFMLDYFNFFIYILYFYFNVNYLNKFNSIKITNVGILDSLLFYKQKINYYIQFISAFFYSIRLYYLNDNLIGKEILEQDVINFILNTTVVTCLKKINGKYIFSYDYYSMLGNIDIIYIELNETLSKISIFNVNNKDISDNIIRLSIMGQLWSTGIHVVSHKYFDIVYNQTKKYNENFHLYGQYLNYIAHTYPASILTSNQKQLCYTLNKNSIIFDKRHVSIKNDEVLLNKSRLLNFLQNIRPYFKEYINNNYPGINYELLLVTSVIHSLDHYFSYKYQKKYWLKSYNNTLSDWRYNYFNLVFNKPAQALFSNYIKDKPKYKDLYNHMANFDKELADNITLSISY